MRKIETIPDVSDTNAKQVEQRLREALPRISRLLDPVPMGLLCRKPLVHEDFPEASDVDLVAIWNKSEEYPQRLAVTCSSGKVFVDVLWIPVSGLLDPVKSASYRMLPHLLLESEVMWVRPKWLRLLLRQIETKIYDEDIWNQRIRSHLSLGDAAFQEARRNIECPPASLFFLQVCHSYYLTALADGLKQSCLSLMTHPLNKARQMALATDTGIYEMLKTILHLQEEPQSALEAVERISQCSTN